MNLDSDVLCYGVQERTKVSSHHEACLEEIRRNGFHILPEVFSKEEMDAARLATDKVYLEQLAEVGGAGNLAKAHDEDLVRCPLAYDKSFLEVAVNERIRTVIHALLGDAYVLLMQNVIINRSKKEQYQAQWHRDLNYQHWTSSKPMAINFLVCVDDFYEDGGGTWVLPSSHLLPEFPSDAYVRKFQLPIEAKSGSVILLDAMTYHRAGHNRVPHFVRRGINHVVGLPFLAQQLDIPRILEQRQLDYGDDSFLSRYLGYRWNPSSSAKKWREVHSKTVR